MIQRALRPLTLLSLLALFGLNCEKTIYTTDTEWPSFAVRPHVSAVTDTSVTIVFRTNEACRFLLQLGVTTDYDTALADSELAETHQVHLNQLESWTSYHYRVAIYDAEDNGPVFSADSTFRTLHNEWSYLREGWKAFATQYYGGARDFFNLARTLNPTNAEILTALAWVQIKDDSLAAALQRLHEIRQYYPFLPVALTAEAYIRLLQDSVQQTIDLCQSVLTGQPEWSYPLNPHIGYPLLRFMLAQAYFHLELFAQAQAQLDLIWPANGLDPNWPATWQVNGQDYSAYELALIAAISYLPTVAGFVI